jgi:hypothetical protein
VRVRERRKALELLEESKLAQIEKVKKRVYDGLEPKEN